jgi:hypothetical protein
MGQTVTTQGAPIIVKFKKKKKKKRDYSEGLQSIQMSEVALTRGANRIASAVSKGLGKYRRSRDKSSRRKRDGMVVDYVPNVGKGISKAVRTGSRLPYDLSRAINHREFRNALRAMTDAITLIKFP